MVLLTTARGARLRHHPMCDETNETHETSDQSLCLIMHETNDQSLCLILSHCLLCLGSLL
jgi:hypothetical protein